MMHEEFEKLAGYEVSNEDYNNVIEPMYMAVNMSKQDFIKCLNRKQFDKNYKEKQIKRQLQIEMQDIANEMHELCGYTDTYEQFNALRDKALEYIEKFPIWNAPNHEFEKAEGYGRCTYVKALVWYDKDWNEVQRLELVC